VGLKRLAKTVDVALAQVESIIISRLVPLLHELLFVAGDMRALVGVHCIGANEHAEKLVTRVVVGLKLTHAALAVCTETAQDCRNFFLWLQQHMRRYSGLEFGIPLR